MISKFKKYLDKIFIFCPKTREILDFKEELLGVLMERFAELVESGLSEEESYKICIKSIDDYRDTIKALELKRDEDAGRVTRTVALLASAAYVIGLLIIYFAVSFGTGRWDRTWLIFILGVVIFAIAGFAYLYVKSKKKSRYFVTRYSILLMTMLASTLVFLISSLVTKRWNLTWLTYIAGAAVWSALDIGFRVKYNVKQYKDADTVIITALSTVLVYLTVSFVTGLWSVSWLIILGGIFVGIMVIITRKLLKLKKSRDDGFRACNPSDNSVEAEKPSELPADDGAKNEADKQ